MKNLSLTTFAEHKRQLMKNPEFREAYHALDEEFAMIHMFLQARLDCNLTQAELAERVGMKQEAIARLESGQGNPTYRTLSRIAKALNKKVALV